MSYPCYNHFAIVRTNDEEEIMAWIKTNHEKEIMAWITGDHEQEMDSIDVQNYRKIKLKINNKSFESYILVKKESKRNTA